MTAENQANTWLNFEAGALAKAVDSSRVVPLAIDLKVSDIENPLGQFQAQPLSIDGLKKIVNAMNGALERPIEAVRLARLVDKWWPDLQKEVDTARNAASSRDRSPQVTRPDRELLEEILTTVRNIARPQPEFTLRARQRYDLGDIVHTDLYNAISNEFDSSSGLWFGSRLVGDRLEVYVPESLSKTLVPRIQTVGLSTYGILMHIFLVSTPDDIPTDAILTRNR